MSITLDIDEALMKKAVEFTGVQNTKQLVEDALQALIEKRAYRLGVELGGNDPEASLGTDQQAA